LSARRQSVAAQHSGGGVRAAAGGGGLQNGGTPGLMSGVQVHESSECAGAREKRVCKHTHSCAHNN
jgi:hypothetical protein